MQAGFVVKSLTIISGITSLVIGLQLPATAGTFTEINFFGDSLLDQGNLFNLTSLPPSPPYFGGRSSNGKLVSDLLAEELNLNPILSTELATTIPTQGVNFAFFGATTGNNNVGGSLFHEFDPNISTQLSNLTTAHNNLLEVKLAELDNSLSESEINLLDANALLSEIFTSPSSFGITDVENSCLTNFRPGFMFDGICSNPDEFLFWDNVHPTARIHQLIAEEAFEVLELEIVPEPNNNWGVLSLMFLGIPYLVFSRTKIKSKY